MVCGNKRRYVATTPIARAPNNDRVLVALVPATPPRSYTRVFWSAHVRIICPKYDHHRSVFGL